MNGIGLQVMAAGCTIAGFVINNFTNAGIQLINANSSSIVGNWIGTDASGMSDSGNGIYGIEATNSTGLAIGGSTNLTRNIISGNAIAGILLSGSGSSTIAGNWIGLNRLGTATIPNSGSGIQLVNSPGTVIGSATSELKNIISGNGASGIMLGSSANTTIAGNLIGLDPTGLTPMPNSLYGIEVENSPNSIVGGSNSAPHNIISANGSSGIKLSSSSDASITGNWIGLDVTGLVARGNSQYGIELTNSSNSTIGGSVANTRNVISGNTSYGIIISDINSSNTAIKGNYIGTTYLGTSAVPNAGGISVLGPDTDIGGTAPGEGNLITGIGTFLQQILISSTQGVEVYGNYIGTNAAGSASLSTNDEGVPSGTGIAIHDSRFNTIGAPGAGNIISGNGTGIELKAGTAANFETTGNIIQSNYIGTNPSGDGAVPNVNGIVITANQQNLLTSNTIGGINSAGSFKGNIISGNGLGAGSGRGIQLVGPLAQNNLIQGNSIGTTRDALADLGNTGPGILIDGSNTIIGGVDAGNVIAHNGDTGITILTGTGNTVTRNQVFDNAGLGIDLGTTSGVNPADPGDSDAGANNLQNFPEFGITAPSKGKIQAQGTLDSTPSETFSIEFFLSDSADDSGYGEGDTLLGVATVTTNAKGVASFTTKLNGTIPDGGGVTATATDSKGNSSEFSLFVRPTKEVKPGGRVDRAPIIAIVDDTVTVSLPQYQPPKKKPAGKKPKRVEISAARAPRQSVEYQISIKGDRRDVARRITSKRNVVTIRNLPPGNYSTSYRVTLKEGKEVVARTRPSPSSMFTVNQPAGGASIRSSIRTRWCPPFLTALCDEVWPF